MNTEQIYNLALCVREEDRPFEALPSLAALGGPPSRASQPPNLIPNPNQWRDDTVDTRELGQAQRALTSLDDTPLLLDQKDDDRSSSINIIPPPPIKRKAPSKAQKRVPQKAASKKAASDHESEANSEDDVVQPSKKFRGKNAKGGKTETLSHDKRHACLCYFHCHFDSLFIPQELVLSVPRASEPGNQRITLTHATHFNEALAVIHSTVGCTDVAHKPVLTYKLSTATAKVPATSLSTLIYKTAGPDED
ncbi:hypothetical protein B0H13DRAFT_2477611 [Mycena leptocephala]|nr:hypothetical protein B0H13DRAFT_2477611 [Mycena leptocephala]